MPKTTRDPAVVADTVAGVPPVEEQAAAMAAAVEVAGHSTAAGAAAEDVVGSARESPGVGSGAVGASVPGDIIAEHGNGFVFTSPVRVEGRDLEPDIRRIVREELERLLGPDPAIGVRLPRGGMIAGGPAPELASELGGPDIEITSTINGLRRGGVAHPARPTPHHSRSFTSQQLAQIEADPALFVRRI